MKNMIKNCQLRAYEISILKSKTLKIHGNAIKFDGFMTCYLIGFSCYWKTNHKTSPDFHGAYFIGF